MTPCLLLPVLASLHRHVQGIWCPGASLLLTYTGTNAGLTLVRVPPRGDAHVPTQTDTAFGKSSSTRQACGASVLDRMRCLANNHAWQVIETPSIRIRAMSHHSTNATMTSSFTTVTVGRQLREEICKECVVGHVSCTLPLPVGEVQVTPRGNLLK